MIIKIMKSIFMILIDIGFCIIIYYCVGMMWDSTYAWKKLDFEYVDNVEFSGEQNAEINGTEPPAMNTADFYDYYVHTQKNTPDFWFFEVRNADEWEYFRSRFGIDEYTLDFTDQYYVFSINRKLTRLRYWESKELWYDVDKYGNLVRADFDLDHYEEGMIYIYRLDRKINFYFNQRDYELDKCNMSARQLNALIDEPYEPYLYVPFPYTVED